MKRVVILGGGSGGAVAAKRLSRWSHEGEVEVVLIDRSPDVAAALEMMVAVLRSQRDS